MFLVLAYRLELGTPGLAILLRGSVRASDLAGSVGLTDGVNQEPGRSQLRLARFLEHNDSTHLAQAQHVSLFDDPPDQLLASRVHKADGEGSPSGKPLES